MRWTTSRVLVFGFSLIVGVACSSVIAQHGTNSNSNTNSSYQTAHQPAEETGTPEQLQPESDSPPVASFEPVEVVANGYTNAKLVRLRETPEATAPVIARLKLPDSVGVEILDATRDYLRIRFPAGVLPPDDKCAECNREGWAAWGEVVPEMSALVLDAETGAIVSRLPFNSTGQALSVTFSPDNSRAVFYSTYTDGQAYEVNTEDYTLTRSFKAQLGTIAPDATSFFYGSADNALYAAFHSASLSQPSGATMLNIVRVRSAKEGPAPAPEISERATAFAVAPDGRTGFILHPADAEAGEMLVDVLDLQGMRVQNTLTLRGESLPTSAADFVTSADGSALYWNLFPSLEALSVIETRTGNLLRQIPLAALKDRAQPLTRQELIGDSMLFHTWEEDAAESRHMWLDGAGKTSKAEQGIDYAVEADGVRLAVNDSGTRLFKLDADNRISASYRIERPDAQFNEGTSDAFSVFNLYASPDGKRLIVVLGVESGC